METLPDLLARWAALAPDECRWVPMHARYELDLHATFTRFIRPATLDNPTFGVEQRADILWHVGTCAERRDLPLEIGRVEGGKWNARAQYGLGLRFHQCLATAALSTYVAALEALQSEA